MDSQYEDVLSVLSDYFEGLYRSDSSVLTRVFHPKAHYVCVTDGSLQRLTMDEYLPIVNQRPSPASRNEPRQDHVVSIEFAGPVTAMAKVECTIGMKDFTDFLSIVFINERWQIISKVFHYDLRE